MLAALVVGMLAVVASAGAGWGGRDPGRNYPLGPLPAACSGAPMGKTCINAGVYYLDKARAKVGLPKYKLPARFAALSQAKQMFVLVNLDRVAYHLPPIPGLTASLDHDAFVKGVVPGLDPAPTSTAFLTAWNANWAGGFANAPMAYEAWMWDDGLGSGNGDCTPSHRAGCWGHRHNVLWRFGRHAVTAMGAAAGFDSLHRRGYATLLVGGASGYEPRYAYTWTQAVAAGAGRNPYDPGTP